MILRELFGPRILLEYSRAAVLRQYGLKLAQKTDEVNRIRRQEYTSDTVAEYAADILSSLESTDPTADKQFSEWIVVTYLRGNEPFITTLLPLKLKQRLARFALLKKQYRHLLPDANINNYKSFDQFIQAIDAVVIPEKVIKNKGKSEEVYRDETVRIIIPRDEAAAIYYGQGTKWCTSSTDPGKNAFSTYRTLFILLPLQAQYIGERYQLHPVNVESKNELDNDVDSSMLITKRFPGLASDQAQIALYKKDPDWRRFFERAGVKLSEKARKELVDTDPAVAIEYDPTLIAQVNDPSEELQLIAIQRDVKSIELIKNPKDVVLVIAIQSNPRGSLTRLRNNHIVIPDYVLKICCQSDPQILEHIFGNWGTPPIEAQIGAVEKNGLAIQFILDAGIRPSEAVQQAAVEQTSDAYEFLIKARIQPSPAVEKLANRN